MHNHTSGAPASIAFSFSTSDLRVVIIDDQPWFVAVDVCTALGIQNTSDAMRTLDDDESTLDTIEGRTPTGGKINTPVRLVNEAGLYCLIFKSRKPEAKAFKRWVTHEVLPAIRKTGQYIAKEDKAAPELMNRLRDKVRMASHGFRYRHKAEAAFNARIRAITGASSATKLTTAQCLHAIDQVEWLVRGCQRHNDAVAKAEDSFLKNFVRGDSPMPLKPDLLLMEKDSSREILPIEVSDADLRNLTNNAVGDEARMLLGHSTGEDEL